MSSRTTRSGKKIGETNSKGSQSTQSTSSTKKTSKRPGSDDKTGTPEEKRAKPDKGPGSDDKTETPEEKRAKLLTKRAEDANSPLLSVIRSARHGLLTPEGSPDINFENVTTQYILETLRHAPEKTTGELVQDTTLDPSKPIPEETFTEEEIATISQSQLELHLADPVELERVQSLLDTFKRTYEYTPVDGNELFSSILSQITIPANYDTERFRKQTSQYLSENLLLLRRVFKEVIEPKQSITSFVHNLAIGYSRGDEVAASFIGKMWNLSITILSPWSDSPINLFHNEEDPDVVIINCGGGLYSATQRAVGRRGTRKIQPKGSKIIVRSNVQTAEATAKQRLVVTARTALVKKYKDLATECEELLAQFKQLSGETSKFREKLITAGVDADKLPKVTSVSVIAPPVVDDVVTGTVSAIDRQRFNNMPVPLEYRNALRYYCDKCSTSCARRTDLVDHVKKNCSKRTYDNPPVFPCEDDSCDKTYKSAKQALEHLHAKHLHTYLYSCELCKQGFYYNSRYSTHKTKGCKGERGKSLGNPPHVDLPDSN